VGHEGEKLLQAVHRRVRDKGTWKDIHIHLNHLDRDGSGKIKKEELRHLLRIHNVVLADKQFLWLCAQCLDEDEDADTSDAIFYMDFMDLFPPYSV